MLQDDDTWAVVFDEPSNPEALSATVTELKTHKLYKFRVFAIDFNGLSEASEVVEIYACALPRYFDRPRYVWSTQTTITIEWDAPLQDGGCPIFDYKV